MWSSARAQGQRVAREREGPESGAVRQPPDQTLHVPSAEADATTALQPPCPHAMQITGATCAADGEVVYPGAVCVVDVQDLNEREHGHPDVELWRLVCCG